MVSKNVVEKVDTVYCRKSEQTEESAMKSLFEKIGGTYHKNGDYFLPDLSLPETTPVGIWGQRRKHYLKTQRGPLYNALLLSGKLNGHLIEVDIQAEAMFSQLVKQLAEQERVTEQLKAENQMEWIGRMNNVQNRATEVICSELIYT